MLALTAANGVGVVLFGTLYALAGARRLSQTAFLACLVGVFALVTALWIWTEARDQTLHPLRRLGRAAIGLLVVVVATPALVLMPLFWLETVLPPEVGASALLAPAMTIVLISLVLVVLTNVLGSIVIVARAARARRHSPV